MNPTRSYLTTSLCINQEAEEHDEELVLAAGAGSHAAFGKLQKAYSHRLYKRIFSITRNHEDAEDALQDTFFRAYLALPSFEGRSKFSTWLTRIAVNSALMTIRKRRTRAEMSLEQQLNTGEEGPSFDVRDKAMDPEQLCDQSQRSCAIRQAIQRLDPKSRAAIAIWVSREHSMKEIAKDLGVSVASVKSRLHRARKRLIRSPLLQNPRFEADASDRDGLNLILQSRA